MAVFRAARIEQVKLLEQGAVLKRIRIDAELKREIARAAESLAAEALTLRDTPTRRGGRGSDGSAPVTLPGAQLLLPPSRVRNRLTRPSRNR